MSELYRFRIRAQRGRWRVERWEQEPPYGPAWQPAFTGCTTVEQAREFLRGAFLLLWDDATYMSGLYTFARAPEEAATA